MATDSSAASGDGSTSNERSVAGIRDAYPSGWRVLTRHQAVAYLVDAVMDAVSRSEFTKTELADRAGVSRQSVHTHVDLLLELDVLDPVADSSPQRYRPNADSDLLTLLHQVEGAVNEQLVESD
jgi:DNA-binding transcriptional ArsR family regulator